MGKRVTEFMYINLSMSLGRIPGLNQIRNDGCTEL